MTVADLAREHLEDVIYPALARKSIFAAELGISETTLSRKLLEEGTCWKAIYNAEVLHRATSMRKEGLTLNEITEALGYAFPQSVQRVLRRAA